MSKTFILGAGLTGLSTAFHLKKDFELLEKESRAGGYSYSSVKNGFIFDYCEHFLRIPTAPFKELVFSLLGKNIEEQELDAKIFFNGSLVDYPFQRNLMDLDSKTKEECLQGLRLAVNKKNPTSKNFEEHILNSYGSGIAKHFMLPYNEKLWTIKPKEMNCSWTSREKGVLNISPAKILEGNLSGEKARKKTRFYPVSGGIKVLPDAFRSRINKISFNQKIEHIDLKNKKLTVNGRQRPFEKIVSTIPLTSLIEALDAPSTVTNAAKKLLYNSVLCVNIGFNKKIDVSQHWIYFPGKEFIFSRAWFPQNFSDSNVPAGRGSASAIFTHSKSKKLKLDKEELFEHTLEALQKTGILGKQHKPIFKDITPLEHAYPLPTLGLEKDLAIIQDFLKQNRIYSIGRYGNWEYSGMEDAIIDGKAIAEKINNGAI